MKYKYLITVLFLLCLALLCFAAPSCTPIKHIHNTGIYKIESRKGNETTFEGIKGKYLVLSDTLKPGDKIHINVIRFYYKSKN